MWSRTLFSSSVRQAARPLMSATAASRPAMAPLVAPQSRLRPSPFLSAFQTRLLSDATRQAITKAVGSAPVVLFMKGTPETPQCGFSRATIQVLGLQGVDPSKFAAFNVLEDEELRSGIKEFSEWPTIPQLYIDNEFVGGCDIILSMHQDGSLAKMLEEKNVLASLEGTDSQ